MPSDAAPLLTDSVSFLPPANVAVSAITTTMSATTYDQYETDREALDVADPDTPLTLLQLKRNYHRLSLLLHPDKNPSEKEKFTELFQNLYNSYQRLREHVRKNTDVSTISGEEADLYQYLTQHNIVKLNIGSVTVKIENCRDRQWEKVLTRKFGTLTLNPDGTGLMCICLLYTSPSPRD